MLTVWCIRERVSHWCRLAMTKCIVCCLVRVRHSMAFAFLFSFLFSCKYVHVHMYVHCLHRRITIAACVPKTVQSTKFNTIFRTANWINHSWNVRWYGCCLNPTRNYIGERARFVTVFSFNSFSFISKSVSDRLHWSAIAGLTVVGSISYRMK